MTPIRILDDRNVMTLLTTSRPCYETIYFGVITAGLSPYAG
jgi:hypothetical protein